MGHCIHCGKEVFLDSEGVAREKLTDEGIGQYCWMDPVHGSQLHELQTIEDLDLETFIALGELANVWYINEKRIEVAVIEGGDMSENVKDFYNRLTAKFKISTTTKSDQYY